MVDRKVIDDDFIQEEAGDPRQDPAARSEEPQPSAEGDEWQSELQRLSEELQQANDRALRAQAELENFRKRTRRELDEERRYAQLPMISQLLPVLDNLARALEAAEQSQAGGLLQGVRMVASQLEAVLEQSHCRRIKAVGEPFDPHRHEAIGQEPSDLPPGTVTRDIAAGYELHDRVVRPSRVFISTGPPPAPTDQEAAPAES